MIPMMSLLSVLSMPSSTLISKIAAIKEGQLDKNKPNCAISSGFAVTYYTNVGLSLAGWLSPGLRPGEASHYFVVSI